MNGKEVKWYLIYWLLGCGFGFFLAMAIWI